MQFYYTIFTVFAIIVYMAAVDENVSKFISLIFDWIKFLPQQLYWRIKLHPRNPIERWKIERRSKKLAESLMKEFQQKTLDKSDDMS